MNAHVQLKYYMWVKIAYFIILMPKYLPFTHDSAQLIISSHVTHGRVRACLFFCHIRSRLPYLDPFPWPPPQVVNWNSAVESNKSDYCKWSFSRRLLSLDFSCLWSWKLSKHRHCFSNFLLIFFWSSSKHPAMNILVTKRLASMEFIDSFLFPLSVVFIGRFLRLLTSHTVWKYTQDPSEMISLNFGIRACCMWFDDRALILFLFSRKSASFQIIIGPCSERISGIQFAAKCCFGSKADATYPYSAWEWENGVPDA